MNAPANRASSAHPSDKQLVHDLLEVKKLIDYARSCLPGVEQVERDLRAGEQLLQSVRGAASEVRASADAAASERAEFKSEVKIRSEQLQKVGVQTRDLLAQAAASVEQCRQAAAAAAEDRRFTLARVEEFRDEAGRLIAQAKSEAAAAEAAVSNIQRGLVSLGGSEGLAKIVIQLDTLAKQVRRLTFVSALGLLIAVFCGLWLVLHTAGHGSPSSPNDTGPAASTSPEKNPRLPDPAPSQPAPATDAPTSPDRPKPTDEALNAAPPQPDPPRAKEEEFIGPENVLKHLGAACRVKMTIRSNGQSRDHKFVYLNSKKPFTAEGNFEVVLMPEVVEAFKAQGVDPVARYAEGVTVVVAGKVVANKDGRPRIEVRSRDQLRVAGEN